MTLAIGGAEVNLFLPIITSLLGIIATILIFGVRIFYDVLQRILAAAEDQGKRIVALENYRLQHDKEVVLYHDTWKSVGDRAFAEMSDLREELRALQRERTNGPER